MLANRQRVEDMESSRTEPDISLLVRLASRGDRSAFEEIYKLHVNRIYALTLRMCADAEQAASLTQDAFVKAWQNLDSFRGDARFSTWLHRLAVNVVLDDQRGRKRRQDNEISDSDLQDDSDLALRSVPALEGRRLDLEYAIGTLPPGARAVFVLHDVEGYPMHEIADLNGTALGTVKAQLHRARRLLREALSC